MRHPLSAFTHVAFSLTLLAGAVLIGRQQDVFAGSAHQRAAGGGGCTPSSIEGKPLTYQGHEVAHVALMQCGNSSFFGRITAVAPYQDDARACIRMGPLGTDPAGWGPWHCSDRQWIDAADPQHRYLDSPTFVPPGNYALQVFGKAHNYHVWTTLICCNVL